MKFRIKHSLIVAATTLAAMGGLTGCATKKAPPPAPAPVATPAPPPVVENKPKFSEAETAVVTAKVQALNRKKRTVTLKFPDGRTTKVTCGPEIRNFDQIQVGDNVTAMFKETVEIAVSSGKDGKPGRATSQSIERAPLGSKPAGTIVGTTEWSGLVQSIDYDTRKVVLQGPNGTKTVTASPSVKRLRDVKPGDLVTVRFTEALAIEVTAPEGKKK